MDGVLPYLCCFEICSNSHIHEEKIECFCILRISGFSLREKHFESPLLIILNRCKLSYFIGYRGVNRDGDSHNFIQASWKHLGELNDLEREGGSMTRGELT